MRNIEFLTLGNLELLAGYFNNCKHNEPKFRSAKVRGKSLNSIGRRQKNLSGRPPFFGPSNLSLCFTVCHIR
jgi:hypothetical protein